MIHVSGNGIVARRDAAPSAPQSVDARHVYVHVPFCARRCSYCDFSIAVRRNVPVQQYLAALENELTIRRGAPAEPQRIDTLYFGGGTPSHLGADGVGALVALMRRWFTWNGDAEITLEANPDDVTGAAARAWRQAGITRVSLGAQTFDDDTLRWMHRSHSGAQIFEAVNVIRASGFASWSFDLIFALPESLERDWDRDLSSALELQPPHLSLYGLTVEPGTPLGKWVDLGRVHATDESKYETEFLQAHQAACTLGYDHYEVSNFAKPGHLAQHNRAYWRQVPYLGFGPSAHGYDGTTRRWNAAAYAAWCTATAALRDPVAGSEILSASSRRTEDVYLGLRTTGGLQIDASDRPLIAPWVSAGWAEYVDQRVVLTALGWLRLDSLAATLTRAWDDTPTKL
jgi:oxygen-independent coproporphyrinogen III oxidase